LSRNSRRPLYATCYSRLGARVLRQRAHFLSITRILGMLMKRIHVRGAHRLTVRVPRSHDARPLALDLGPDKRRAIAVQSSLRRRIEILQRADRIGVADARALSHLLEVYAA